MGDKFFECVTKQNVRNYYKNAWLSMKDDLVGHLVGVVCIRHEERIFRRNHYDGRPIKIDGPYHLFKLIEGYGAVELVPDIERVDEPGLSRMAMIDIDSYTSLERTKKVVLATYYTMKDAGYDPFIVSTGSRAGFHVKSRLPEPVPFRKLKTDLLDTVIKEVWKWKEAKKLMLDPKMLAYPVSYKNESNKVFLDLAPLKKRGGVKAVGSVNAKTGAIVKVISPDKLERFDPSFLEVCNY